MENFTPSKAHNQHLVVNETLSRQSRDNHETFSRDKHHSRPRKHVAMIFAVLMMSIANVGMAWAQTSWVRLDSIDFTNTTNFPAQTLTGQTKTISGVYFFAKSSKNIKVNNTSAGIDFDGSNGGIKDHAIAIPVTGVNEELKIIVYHDLNNTSANFRTAITHSTNNIPTEAQTTDLAIGNSGAKNKNDYVQTKNSLTGSNYIVWVCEAGSSYKVVKRVAIYTKAPSCAATAPGNISKGSWDGAKLTLTAAGSAASGDTWYWQIAADGTEKGTYGSGATKDVTAAATWYLRSYNTADDCWSSAKSITVDASDLLTAPTVAFTDGTYEVGSSALNLSSLFSSNSDGAVTYSVKTDGGTNASIAGTSFSATKAGTCVVTATQAATAAYSSKSVDANIVVTYPATGTATITYNLDVTNGGSTLQTTSVDATVSTITVATSTSLLAGGLGISSSKGTHNGTRTLGINTLSAEDADKYFYVTFNIADGYQFTPSAISLKVLTIGGNATSYKAVLTDGVHSITGTANATNDSELTLGNWTNLGSTILTGTVTLKLYAWYTTSGSYNAYRLSTPITITGTVAAPLPCSNPDAPTAFANTDIAGTSATFSITDDANAASYDLYYSTSSTAPTAGTEATTNVTTKTPTITGLAPSTTYYAWVRAVCDASHKSSWVALTGSTFTTSAAATYTVTYNGNSSDGGSVPTDASSPYASGATVTVLGNTGSLTRTIYGSVATFYGWNTNSSGYGGMHYEAGNTFSITANTTLYAEWGYPITYNTDGGTINDLSYPTHYIYTGDDDCTTDALPTNVTKSGYTFDGWYTSNGAGSLVTCIEGSYTGAFSGDYALKAKWSEADGCEEIFAGEATGTTTFSVSVGSATTNLGSGGDSFSAGGYSYSVKPNSSNAVVATPKDGKSFAAGDSLIVVVYNNQSGSKNMGFTLGSGTYRTSVAAKTLHVFRQVLVASDINGSGKVPFNRQSSDDRWVEIIIKKCGVLPTCTTPTIPSLSDQTVCPGSDIAAWDATVSNAADITAAGESVAYSWKKKGSDTELATTASFDLGSSATESQAGTYVVKVTVSKAGCANATASAEVDLTVTPTTEEPSISSNKAKVYAGDAVTLTATCGSTGVTWAWYTCAADGTSAVATGSTSSTQSIASAPIPGTYYYKVVATGDGTHSCGAKEYIYTLIVNAPSDCETHVWWEEGAPTGEVQATCFTFGATPSGSNGQSASMTIDGTTYNSTKRSSDWNNTIQFTIPANATGTFYICGKGTGARTITLTDAESHTSTFSMTTTFGTFHSDEIGEGTWTMTTNGNLHIGMVALQICVASTCTDAMPTIAAVNTTVCSGSELSISATGYEDGATLQWQKLNGSAWDNISGATSATYTVASAAAANAGSYRFIATKDCNRTSNTVTIAVPSVPVFGEVPSSVTVMQTQELSITTVEATDAVSYKWYKSTDATWDAGDTEIGSAQSLVKADDSEAIGSPSYYVFCRATNSCGTTTSSAIAVNVTAYVEEDCATRGNEGEAEFGFNNKDCSQGSYSETACWTSNSRTKYLTYSAPDGKYIKTAKLTVAVSSGSKCAYAIYYSGAWHYAELTLNSTLTEKTIDLSAHNVDSLRIGRNLKDGGGTEYGVTSGNFYLSKACFQYTNACTSTTVTVSPTSKSYTIGGAWTAPTITLGPAAVASETLTYSSSNEDIATVDDDGTVNFQGMAGTVTITASYAGGTISATEYCASEGSYTITVSCSDGAPKIFAASSVNLSGCNSEVTLNAKQSNEEPFASGTYQWYRNGEAISGATSSTYTAVQAGTYTVERTGTGDCTSMSSNSAVVTSETVEPEIERLTPFQYYHVDRTYTDQMKMRHLFSVKGSSAYGSTGKNYKMELSKNNGAPSDVTISNAFSIVKSDDNTVDTVILDLNKLNGKYAEGDELVLTCKAVDCSGNVSDTYKNSIIIYVIDDTPTLALICSGANGDGTRSTKNMVVGGDFLTGYNKADLCQQTGNTTFDASQEWGLYTELKSEYIVTPVNGYAPFNKLNYEPFDILFLTDYPKASKSDAAKDILDDMAALCDYRPLFSFKTHMVAKSPSKWAAKGFTTSATENKADGRLNLNIVCYAHPMFDAIKTGEHVYTDTENTSAPLVYTMLSGTGYEGNKGMQGFEIAAAENFVTIGLTHYNADIATSGSNATWTPGDNDRMLVTVAERQTNIEARMILFSVNAGAHSKLTDKGEQVVLACLRYLLDHDPLHVADCAFTFDNGASNEHDAEWYEDNCSTCTGTKGDGLWSTAANWAPDYRLLPGEFTSVRIAAPVEVNLEHAHVMDVRIKEGGSIDIPAGKALEVKSTIRHLDGSEISPTEDNDLYLGSTAAGNGTLIFNNNTGDTKARVAMYSNAQADTENMSAATSIWQYIGTPHTDVTNARSNYYGSWIYQYGTGGKWEVIPNGGTLEAFRGYCITNETAPIVYNMTGTLAATTSKDIDVPAGYTVVANSWTAPIDINKLTNDDLENISDKTIYFFNTGTDVNGTAGTGTAAGTYRAAPISASKYTGDWQIPSMQGFYVSTTTAGTLHLDYDRHVRPNGSRTIVSNPMYAPRRAKAAETNEPIVLKLFARGSRYHERLVVLEREDFTRAYDSGWDGEAWDGSDLSPMIYVTGEGRQDAVSAVPEFEGTVIAFRAGEDQNYTIDFIYDAENEPLYLLDTETKVYTRVVSGNAYHFTTSDKVAHNRFILTRTEGQQTPTGWENLTGEEEKAVKFINNDKLFIFVHGVLYDATGKVVR